MTTVIKDGERVSAEPQPAGPVSAAAKARAKGSAGGGLYKPRMPIYPKAVHGFWRKVKWALLVATLAVYYVTPWLRWSRPGNLPQQAVLVDFDHARFYFFGIQLWPEEVYFITGLLVIAALALFLVSALFGRLWCGYACPQTVWTDLYMTVERWIEGDRNARMRLDAEPWSLNKAWRKGLKHAVWLGVAFGTGGAWIFYFHDAPDLIAKFWVGQAPMASYVSCGLLTFTTYVLAGTMREQVCTYMCPWPRIQGAMLDKHSLQVTYRKDRGEPRGPHKKGDSWAGRGDCVDCNACVVACPMGIDIRDGSQLECINCGLCIDACDEIMLKVDRPVALIGYDTDAAVAARACGQKPSYPLVRARTALYAAVLALVGGLMLWGLLNRPLLVVHAIRDRNPTFVRLHDGSIRSGYTLKIANRGFQKRTLQVGVEGLPGAMLKTPGEDATHDMISVEVEPNDVRAVRVLVTAAGAAGGPSKPIAFLAEGDGPAVRTPTVFMTGDAHVPD
ncbi:MAG: cytochrome c oxidase accessory protein CcoG [Caulobacteraceae bacterium]